MAFIKKALALCCLVQISTSKLLTSTSRIYSNAAEQSAEKTKDWALGEYRRWIDQSSIEIVNYVDSGRFSTVFEGILSDGIEMNDIDGWGASNRVIVKVLKPIQIDKLKKEIKLLELLKECDGIIHLHGVTKNSGCQTLSLIFEHLGPNVQWLSHNASESLLTEPEIKAFTLKLLRALNACHSNGVMHRDVKPRNVLINRKLSQLRIIDFGLSDFYIPGQEYNPSVASRHYKAPELLFNYPFYDYGIDIWSVGCVFAGLIFAREPFFNGVDSLDQIQRIASVLGSGAILMWALKYKIKLSSEVRKRVGSHRKRSFIEFRNTKNSHLCSSPQAIDLAAKMLTVDHQKRPTVLDCIAHPYFDDVRDVV